MANHKNNKKIFGFEFPLNAETRDSVKGSLWGLLVGDALGSPLQFGPAMKKENYLREMIPCGVFNTPKGCWTDDGSLALCVIDSFNRCKKCDIKDIGNTFWKWQEDGYLSSMPYSFDEGGTTSRAITEFHRTGRLFAEPAYGTNGGIMRYCPGFFIGAAYGLREIPKYISNLTHTHIDCQEAADYLFNAIRYAMAGKYNDIPLGNNVTFNTDSGKLEFDSVDKVHPSGMAMPVMDAVLWAFHKTTSFEDALVEIINLGNDSDTSGAICGQIAGAYYGYSSIPRRWIENMKDWKKLDKMIDEFIDNLEEFAAKNK